MSAQNLVSQMCNISVNNFFGNFVSEDILKKDQVKKIFNETIENISRRVEDEKLKNEALEIFKNVLSKATNNKNFNYGFILESFQKDIQSRSDLKEIESSILSVIFDTYYKINKIFTPENYTAINDLRESKLDMKILEPEQVINKIIKKANIYYYKINKTFTPENNTAIDGLGEVPNLDMKILEPEQVINKIIKIADSYKREGGSDKKVLIEMYGVALGMSQEIGDIDNKKGIKEKIYSLIKEFVREDTDATRNIELSNLLSNLDRFRTRLKLMRKNFFLFRELEQELKDFQSSFEALIKDIFDYLYDMLRNFPRDDCHYAIITMGSFATQMTTPYSDIEYAILVNKNSEEIQVCFTNLADLFDLIMTAFGESPLDKAKPFLASLKEDLPKYFLTGVGVRVDKYKKPQRNFRFYGLINTPEELLKKLPLRDKRIHEKGEHMTSALLTTRYLVGNNPILYDSYQKLFVKLLPTSEYFDCLSGLLKEDIRAFKTFIAELDSRSSNEEIEIKELLIHSFHLVRLLAIFLVCCNKKIVIKSNFEEIIKSLQDVKLLSSIQHGKWDTLIKNLFWLRLELQIENEGASLIKVGKLRDEFKEWFTDETPYSLLNQMVTTAEDQLNLNRNMQPSSTIGDIYKQSNVFQIIKDQVCTMTQNPLLRYSMTAAGSSILTYWCISRTKKIEHNRAKYASIKPTF